MKQMILVIFSLFLCANGFAAQNLSSVAHKDISLGIVFPKTLGGMEFCEVNEYQEPGFGYSLRYERADLMKADIYIYDKGILDIPTGCNNRIVKKEADSIKKLIEIMQKRGYYKEVTFLRKDVVPKKGDIQFIWLKFEYIQEKDSAYTGKRVSDRFITGYAGKFIKISITYKKTNTKSGQKISVQLIKELIAILKKADNICENPKTKAILEAIEMFKKDPLSSEGVVAMRKIVAFAENSDAVLITIESKYCPWINGEEIKQGHVLLAAYIAGNIKPQLEKNKTQSHSYEGVLQIISTYKQLRINKNVQKIASIEKWIQLQKSRQLKHFIETK